VILKNAHGWETLEAVKLHNFAKNDNGKGPKNSLQLFRGEFNNLYISYKRAKNLYR
jgi:hypothetical protein